GGTSPVLASAGIAVTVGTGNFIHGLTLGNGTTALSGSAFGTLTANDNVVVNSNGQAINLTNGTLTATFNSVTSTGGSTNISLVQVAGTSNFGSGALSGAIGTNFAMGTAAASSGGTASITYSGSITQTVSGQAPIIAQNRTGGTLTLSGAITATSAGVHGISLLNNTGATTAFSGPLSLSTTTNPAFTATGGGTVTATDTTSTATTTTATAVNVANTTIGAGGLKFLSVSSNGSAKGIVLNTTGPSGGLTVSGTGAVAGSGGIIQNITTRGGEFISTTALSLKNMNFTNANTTDGGTCSDLSTAACNAAIYLSSVTGVTLDRIAVSGTTSQQAINGLAVSNFTLSNSILANCGTSGTIEEGCIKMRGLTGTGAITNSTLSFPAQDAVEIVNSTGPLLTLNISGSTFSDSQSSSSGGDGVQARSEGTASMVLNITNNSFLRLRSTGLQATAINSASNDVDVTGNIFDPGSGTMIGIDLDADNTGNLVFNVQNNPMIYARNGPAVNVFGDTNATINGRISNNLDVQVKSNVGSNVGSGIRANINKDASGKIEVKNNIVTIGSDNSGIDLSGIGKTAANPGGATRTLDATVTNNTVTIGPTSSYGVFIVTASNAGDTNANCSNVASNAITRNPSSTASFRARVASANGFFLLQAFTSNAEATWNANSNTPTSAGGSEVSVGGAGTFATCTAALPTNPGPN
ncbi:MAG: hypothetical protein ABI451_00335, partial [Dokdonella sp.]